MSDRPLCVCCRQQPADARWGSFCSKRCQMVDLGRWLSGNYRVAGAAADPSSGKPDDEALDEP